MKRKVEKDYKDLAKSLGFVWLGPLPTNTHCKTLWLCDKKHEFVSRYHDILQGKGCVHCYGNVKKIEKDYHLLAKQRGFKWVGKCLPKNTKSDTMWLCNNNHVFVSKYNTIHQGFGCTYCYGNVKKTEYDYHRLAKEKEFKWVDKKLPKNVHTLTLWKCNNYHVFVSRYSDIQKDAGCPYCQDLINGAPVSKPQRKLNNLLCGFLNYPEGRKNIDVAIIRKNQKIAVEYDCQYWHEGNEKYDLKRDKFLIARGWKIIHVKSRNLLPTRKQLKKAINKVLNNENIINIFLEDWKI